MTDTRDQQRLDLLQRTLEPYYHELKLQWGIGFIFNDSDMIAYSINSRPARKIHEISINSKHLDEVFGFGQSAIVFEPGNARLAAMVHELAHAHLAEIIDPVFGSTKIRYSRNKAIKDQQQRGSLFDRVSSTTLDFWVDDVLFDHWPAMVDTGTTYLMETLLEDAKKGDYRRLDYFGPMGLSYILADRYRHGLPDVDIFPLIDYWNRHSPQFAQRVRLLQEHGQKVPRLPTNPPEAIGLYESTVNERLRLVEAPVTAQLVPGKRQYEWKLTQVTAGT